MTWQYRVSNITKTKMSTCNQSSKADPVFETAKKEFNKERNECFSKFVTVVKSQMKNKLDECVKSGTSRCEIFSRKNLSIFFKEFPCLSTMSPNGSRDDSSMFTKRNKMAYDMVKKSIIGNDNEIDPQIYVSGSDIVLHNKSNTLRMVYTGDGSVKHYEEDSYYTKVSDYKNDPVKSSIKIEVDLFD